MTRGRRPRAAIGLVVVTLALGVVVGIAAPGASQTSSSSVVRGMVRDDGAFDPSGAGWTVTHPAPGVYELAFGASDARIELDRWDAVADVTVTPIGAGTGLILFTDATGPVDSTFSFTAIVRS